MAILLIFLPLSIALLVLYGLSQATDRLVMRILGRGWYLATMWPGVIIHELSHLIGCLITFTRVYEVKLFAPSGETLGYVSHRKTRNPISNIIISTAPLFGTSLVIWLLMRLLLPDAYQQLAGHFNSTIASGSLLARDALNVYWDAIRHFFAHISFTDWKTYLFTFFMITLASHAAPSRIDLSHTTIGIIGLAVLFAFIAGLDSLFHLGFTEQLVHWFSWPLYYMTIFITYSVLFAGIAFVILAFAALVKRSVVR